MDRQVRWFIIETKQGSHPQVTVDRVHIERGNGNAMRVRDPGTLPRAAPAVVRHVPEIVLSGNCPREFDRPIKPDAHSRTTDERKQSRTYLAMHVDHKIVFRATDLLQQIEKSQYCAPSPA